MPLLSGTALLKGTAGPTSSTGAALTCVTILHEGIVGGRAGGAIKTTDGNGTVIGCPSVTPLAAGASMSSRYSPKIRTFYPPALTVSEDAAV